MIVSIPNPCCISYFYISYMFQCIFSFICYMFLSHREGVVGGIQCLFVVSPSHTHLPFG